MAFDAVVVGRLELTPEQVETWLCTPVDLTLPWADARSSPPRTAEVLLTALEELALSPP